MNESQIYENLYPKDPKDSSLWMFIILYLNLIVFFYGIFKSDDCYTANSMPTYRSNTERVSGIPPNLLQTKDLRYCNCDNCMIISVSNSWQPMSNFRNYLSPLFTMIYRHPTGLSTPICRISGLSRNFRKYVHILGRKNRPIFSHSNLGLLARSMQ